MIALVAALGLVALQSNENAGEWPHWRGPARDGVSSESDWKNEGKEAPLWEREVGIGHSSPSIAGERLFTVGFDSEQELDRVVCLNAETGEQLWALQYSARIRDTGHGGGTLTTPAVFGGRVFVTSREGALRCLDAESGEVLWLRDLARDLDTAPLAYGFGGSPLVLDDKVVCNVGKTVAVDAETGETLWATRDLLALYSTPTTFDLDGVRTVATFTKEGLFLLDEATGDERFHFPWRKGSVTVNAASPVIVGERIFISSSYNHGCALIDFSTGEPGAMWENKSMGTKLSASVLVGDYLYGFDDSKLKCIDLDGKERWRKRGLGMGALMAADGRLLVASEKGELLIVAAEPDKYVELSSRRVFTSGVCWTNPVLSKGRVYLRNALGRLVCLDHR